MLDISEYHSQSKGHQDEQAHTKRLPRIDGRLGEPGVPQAVLKKRHRTDEEGRNEEVSEETRRRHRTGRAARSIGLGRCLIRGIVGLPIIACRPRSNQRERSEQRKPHGYEQPQRGPRSNAEKEDKSRRNIAKQGSGNCNAHARRCINLTSTNGDRGRPQTRENRPCGKERRTRAKAYPKSGKFQDRSQTGRHAEGHHKQARREQFHRFLVEDGKQHRNHHKAARRQIVHLQPGVVRVGQREQKPERG